MLGLLAEIFDFLSMVCLAIVTGDEKEEGGVGCSI